MSTWQPIETAPKDDRLVLVFIPTPYSSGMKYYCETWCCRYFDSDFDTAVRPAAKPTHWMPLPEPPERKES